MKIRLTIILFIITIVLLGCGKKGIDRLTIKYTSPYYVINLSSKTPVYENPDEKSIVRYRLENYRIVKMNASVTVKKPEPIWYLIESSDAKGYVLSKDFKIFETRKEAENFLLDRFPGRDVMASFSVYQLAEKDYVKRRFVESADKLRQFINLKKNLKSNFPSIYYTTRILIGRLYLKEKKAQKSLLLYQELLRDYRDVTVTLFGKNFDPNAINFYSVDMESYIKRQSHQGRHILLKWEVYFYLGLAFEMKEEYRKAKKCYEKIIERNKDELNTASKILYINYAIDRYIALTESDNQLSTLESFKEKLDVRGNGRYLLYKMATVLESQLSNNSVSDKDLPDFQKRVTQNYKKFIELFDRHFQKNPYPGEVKHYLVAQERVRFVENPESALKSEKIERK